MQPAAHVGYARPADAGVQDVAVQLRVDQILQQIGSFCPSAACRGMSRVMECTGLVQVQVLIQATWETIFACSHTCDRHCEASMVKNRS